MKLGIILLTTLAIMAIPVLGDTITFATTPAAGELTWNNTGSITYGQTPPAGYSTPTNPTAMLDGTGYDRYARVGTTSNQIGRMSLTPGSDTDTVMVSLEFANTTLTSTTAGLGTSVGITKATMNLYGSEGLKVAFVNSGTAARYGRLMFSNTSTTAYTDFTGRSSANDITLVSGKWYKLIGYFTKTTTDNLWDIQAQLWNITDNVKIDDISQTGVIQINAYDGGDVVAGFSLNRSSATYAENLTWGIQQIPEPATMTLSAIGVMFLAVLKKRK